MPPATSRIHEADFCAQIASYSNAIFSAHPEYPFNSARIEGFGHGTQKAKRKDLRIYGKSDRLVLCGEVKLPGTPEGRSPYADDLVRDAHQKADDAGVQYFFTWNVNLFVLWNRKKWDVPLLERRVREWKLGQDLTTPEDAGRSDILAHIEKRFLPSLLADLAEICTGRRTDWAMPPDDIFIRSMESHLEWPILLTRSWILQQAEKSKSFDSKLQEWMAGQDWTFVRKDPQEWFSAIHRAASSLAYLLMNRIIFYKALYDKFRDLPLLDFKPRTTTAARAYSNLQDLFEKVVKRSGDYEPLFYPHERDWAGTLVFEASGAIQAWRGVLRAIGSVDFHKLPSDILGRIFQRLIGPEERHRYGQHFTGDDVVDLINAFCIRSADATVLDPACGSGSFLVRAYYRKKNLKPRKSHVELLSELFGSDIALYPAHLATLNLAAREINEEANYPRIARRNFLHFQPNKEFCRLPAGPHGKELSITIPNLDAAVANPPYVRQEKIEKKEKNFLQDAFAESFPDLRLSGRSDYHCYFWPAAAQLLREGAYFGFLTSSSWLDVEYGFRLQRWALQNFQLLAVMESNAEPWFPDARVKTCVTIMRKCSDEAMRMGTLVRFVQFKKPLAEIIGVPVEDEPERQQAVQSLREEIESASDTADDRMRIIVKRQSDLWDAGVRAGRILDQESLLASGPEDEADEENVGGEAAPVSISVGDYAAGKWGRYVRAPDFYFDIMREFGGKFAPLGDICHIRRGITSGCDAFFMPHDITQESLERFRRDGEFRHNFGGSWLGGVDGQCPYCRRGLENLCDNPVFTGYTVDGGYAEFAVARADFVFPLPGALDDIHAAPLLCAGIIGFRSIRVAGVVPGERVGLFGFGASAHLAIAVLNAWKCDVFVSTRGESHRQLAVSLGAKWVGSEDERPPLLLDRAITFAPSGAVVLAALGSLLKGGVVAINAIHLDRMPAFDYDKLLWGERQIRSVTNMTRADGRDFLETAAQIGLRPTATVFPLAQANEALLAVKNDAINGAAVLVA